MLTDYQLRCPAYFDVSVCSTSTIQPAHISSSTSSAGMAAAAGEDAKHLAIVEKVYRGSFHSTIVVECFGIWAPFALSVLHSSADRTTTCSGISPQKWPEEMYFNNFLYVHG